MRSPNTYAPREVYSVYDQEHNKVLASAVQGDGVSLSTFLLEDDKDATPDPRGGKQQRLAWKGAVKFNTSQARDLAKVLNDLADYADGAGVR